MKVELYAIGYFDL